VALVERHEGLVEPPAIPGVPLAQVFDGWPQSLQFGAGLLLLA
jgi:hypothetical protein